MVVVVVAAVVAVVVVVAVALVSMSSNVLDVRARHHRMMDRIRCQRTNAWLTSRAAKLSILMLTKGLVGFWAIV